MMNTIKEYVLVIINLNNRELFWDPEALKKRKETLEAAGYETKVYYNEFREVTHK